MTAADPEIHTTPPPSPDDPAVDRLARICPYLEAVDGAWRSASVAREHRCGAVTPPAVLGAEKQRRLCLVAAHSTCSTYEAARAARRIGPERVPTLPRPLARTTPVVLDHGRLAIAVPALHTDRSPGQAVLIILMALAFAAIVLAKLGGATDPASASDASPDPNATALTSARPSVGSTTAPTTDPGSSVVPSAGSSGSAASGPPSVPATRTYRVKSGDTLIGIAARFGTTPKAISQLNGITDPSSLKIGQTLKIP
jgi:LysM repeat protein